MNKLLEIFSLQQILNFYLEKFSDGSIFHTLKSLVYFNDAEEQEDPFMFDSISWKDVKSNIINAQLNFIHNSGLENK